MRVKWDYDNQVYEAYLSTFALGTSEAYLAIRFRSLILIGLVYEFALYLSFDSWLM